ncbi:MAG: hypothetical protein IJF50_09725 [Peptococcaceae bacterium]|nr:hypothetical protein [Peptococcaceae bacterium]
MRKITEEMERRGRKKSCHTNLLLLNSVIGRYNGGINEVARMSGIRKSTLHRKMSGRGDFNVIEILRLSYTLRLTVEQIVEIFLVGYQNEMTA